jgi:hypothetical protein
VRHGGDDLVDTARTMLGTLDGAIQRQPGDRRKWVSVKLGRRTSQERDQRDQESHIEVRELWQLAQLARQPFELVVADLEHRLEKSVHDPINSKVAPRAARAVAAGRLPQAAT